LESLPDVWILKFERFLRQNWQNKSSDSYFKGIIRTLIVFASLKLSRDMPTNCLRSILFAKGEMTMTAIQAQKPTTTGY
jgi:hypothetical protein